MYTVPHVLSPPLKCSKICAMFLQPHFSPLWPVSRTTLHWPEPRRRKPRQTSRRRWKPHETPRFPVGRGPGRCGAVGSGEVRHGSPAGRRGEGRGRRREGREREGDFCKIEAWILEHFNARIVHRRPMEGREGKGRERGRERGRGIFAIWRHESWSTSTARIVHGLPCICVKTAFYNLSYKNI